jgi:glycosyltransferase involved in cell wall biosynthesis
MRILITSILVKSGVLTHTRDLAIYLSAEGVDVSLALLNSQKVLQSMKIKNKDIQAMTQSFNQVPVFYYQTYEDLCRIAARQKIQLVHAQSPRTFDDSARLAESRSIPLILTLHGIIDWKRLHSHVMNRADGIIAVGPETAKSTGASYSSMIHVIYNGIDTDKFRPGPIAPRAQDPLNIIWFGRTNGNAAKGVMALDKAIGLMRRKNKPINARVIGSAAGTNVNHMKKYGWFDNPIPLLQQGSIAFGRGRALREAMSCGNAGFLLGQGYGGRVCKEWFEKKHPASLSADPKHGYPLADFLSIAHDLEQYFHRHSLLVKARSEARQIALKYFDVRIMVQETLQVYSAALKKMR